MKVSPKSDYPIQVILESDEKDNQLFAGIFRVILNHTVRVFFVPDVSQYGPPWDERWVPSGPQSVTTMEMARGNRVYFSQYAVTPNAERAGTEELSERLADGETIRRVVFYVTAAEFDRYAADLEQLSEIVWDAFPEQRASQLRGYQVVRFLEQRVVGSGLLLPYDAMMLRHSD